MINTPLTRFRPDCGVLGDPEGAVGSDASKVYITGRGELLKANFIIRMY